MDPSVDRNLNSRSQLKVHIKKLPEKQEFWFRYDPPVLIVAVTWHDTRKKYGQLLHDRLAFSYFNNEESVSDPLVCDD